MPADGSTLEVSSGCKRFNSRLMAWPLSCREVGSSARSAIITDESPSKDEAETKTERAGSCIGRAKPEEKDGAESLARAKGEASAIIRPRLNQSSAAD